MWTIASVGLALGLVLLGIVARTGRPARIRSLAVLPFENVAHDPAQDFLSAGLTSELIAALSRIPTLRVLSAAPADAVLEGSVTRSGEDVHIAARLIESNGRKQLWSGNYQRPLRALPGAEAEIAQKIAGAVHAPLVLKVRPINPEAYELYLEGQFSRAQDGEEPARRGIQRWSPSLSYHSGPSR